MGGWGAGHGIRRTAAFWVYVGVPCGPGKYYAFQGARDELPCKVLGSGFQRWALGLRACSSGLKVLGFAGLLAR